MLLSMLSRTPRSVTIALLGVYMLTATCMSEVLKVPVLLSHFIEHQSQNEDVTFGRFIFEHYHGDDGDDSDNATDNQLPFNSSDCLVGSVTQVGFPGQQFANNLRVAESVIDTGVKFAPPSFALQNYSSTIWQPPKGTILG